MTLIRIALLGLILTPGFGCRICQTCDEYPAFGGSWQRTNRVSGRVGSVFDPAGAKVASAPVESWEPESGDLPREDERTDLAEPPEDTESVLEGAESPLSME